MMKGRPAFPFALVGATIGVPWILFFLTMFLRRPSPRRDALAIVLRELFFLTVLGWMALAIGHISRKAGSPATGWIPSRSPIFWFFSTLVGLGFLSLFIVIPDRRCPSCRRRLLIRPQTIPRVTKRWILMFEFIWCVGCGARWKYNKGIPAWTDASDPSYDEWFGLGPKVTARRRLAEAWKVGRRI
jgi:hypothetical protein